MSFEGQLIPRCPQCQRFASNVILTVNGLGDAVKCEGDCKKHGRVNITEWDWEMFGEDC